jgi:hypothetical protein
MVDFCGVVFMLTVGLTVLLWIAVGHGARSLAVRLAIGAFLGCVCAYLSALAWGGTRLLLRHRLPFFTGTKPGRIVLLVLYLAAFGALLWTVSRLFSGRPDGKGAGDAA